MKRPILVIAKTYDKKNQLLSMACNSYTKTHPIQAHFARLAGMPHRIYLHAEIWAILKAGDKQIHRIEIRRYGANGELRPSNPCPVCKLAISACGIKYINLEFSYEENQSRFRDE